jgi:hypothetical protein
MKTIILILLLTSCASTDLMITKKYIGKVMSHNGDQILTSRGDFHLYEPVEPPDTAYCYLRYIEQGIPGSVGTYYVLYFTWEGTDSIYKVKQNPFTGEIF